MAAILAMDALALLYSGLVLLATATSGNCPILSLQTPPKSVAQLSTTVVLRLSRRKQIVVDCDRGFFWVGGNRRSVRRQY